MKKGYVVDQVIEVDRFEPFSSRALDSLQQHITYLRSLLDNQSIDDRATIEEDYDEFYEKHRIYITTYRSQTASEVAKAKKKAAKAKQDRLRQKQDQKVRDLAELARLKKKYGA